MVDKIIKGASGNVEIPVWLIVLLVPIMVAIATVISTQAQVQSKLLLQAEVNKADIKELKEKKADLYIISRMELTLDRIELKIDEHINKEKQ